MDITTFIAQNQEFRDVDPALVQAALDRAARWTPADVWGDRTDDGVSLLAAHYIQTNPMGGGTRLAPDKDTLTSTYKTQYDELADIMGAGGFLVAGGR